jgi:eukaryotic-like serine/threonine-protein kinase
MKKKFFALIGVMLAAAVLLGGCASGLQASGWPGLAADKTYAYMADGPYIYAVNLQTGAQAWRFPEKPSAANPFYAVPALTPDGTQLIAGGYDKKLYSIDPKTGKSTWTFADARDRWIGGPLVTDKMIFAPNADYKLYALNLQGALQWSFEADQSIWGTPATDGTNIYFGTLGRKVYAVNASTGQEVWMQKVDGAVLGSPVVGQNKILYVGTYGGTVYGLNTSNGQSVWNKQASSWIWSGPILVGDNLYFGDANGKLYGFPVSGNGQPWTQELSGAIVGSPLVTDKSIMVGTEAGSMYVMDPDGKNPRPIAVSGKIYATPLKAGTLLLVAPTSGSANLVALDESGTVKWSFIPPK